MKRTFMYTGTRYSNSAKLVAKLMGIKRIRVKGSKYRPRLGDKLINWGSAVKTNRVVSNVIKWFNEPPLKGVNKLTCFNILKEHDVSIPEYTTARNLVDANYTWLARHTLTGSGGRGITIINPGDPVPPAPLYVKYIPKKYEVRIHVANGKTFDVQQKMQRRGVDANHKIRSHDNGFVFVRHGMSIPDNSLEICKRQGEAAVQALGMSFGAVDVIFNERQGKAYVLEVNSSPGVENSTAENYASMLREMVR
jgi:glutathione synthase/RimK-type ligase-like ATP-grasp enzyme